MCSVNISAGAVPILSSHKQSPAQERPVLSICQPLQVTVRVQSRQWDLQAGEPVLSLPNCSVASYVRRL